MARLIVKSPYIKCGGTDSGDVGGIGGYLKYIATRERVQIIADDRPPTRRQEQLIRHLLRDFPDVKKLDEYESYEAVPTKCAASALISMALEVNWPEANRSEVYLKYIATRPRAERIGEHGLFGDEDGVDLEKAMAELENYRGNVWTHIISLKREDAMRLSYGYLPKSLKPLVDRIVDEMEQLPAIADCYETWWKLQCQVNDFYSEQERRRPPLSRQKEFRAIKNAVIREAELLRSGAVTFEDAGLRLKDEQDDDIGGSSSYHYLKHIIYDESRSLNERDEAVEELSSMAENGDPHAQYLLGKLYRDGSLVIPDTVQARDWFIQAAEQELPAAQYALGKLYLSNDAEVRNPERGMMWLERAAQNGIDYAAYRLGKEYLRGRVVEKDVSKAAAWFMQAAESENPYAQYMLGKLYLEGKDVLKDEKTAVYWLTQSAGQENDYARHLLDHRDQPPSVLLSVTRLLYHIGSIFRDNVPPRPGSGAMSVDRKLRRKIREKKIAMGHKPDDHEEYQGPTMTM